MTQTRLLHLICRRYRIRTAHLSDARLSPQHLSPPVCVTREDKLPSLDTSGLVFFGSSEEEIAVDETGSLTAFDAEKWACFCEEPEAPPPSQSAQPSKDSVLIRVLRHAVEELGLVWTAPEEPASGFSTSGSSRVIISLPHASDQLSSCQRSKRSSLKLGELLIRRV